MSLASTAGKGTIKKDAIAESSVNRKEADKMPTPAQLLSPIERKPLEYPPISVFHNLLLSKYIF